MSKKKRRSIVLVRPASLYSFGRSNPRPSSSLRSSSSFVCRGRSKSIGVICNRMPSDVWKGAAFGVLPKCGCGECQCCCRVAKTRERRECQTRKRAPAGFYATKRLGNVRSGVTIDNEVAVIITRARRTGDGFLSRQKKVQVGLSGREIARPRCWWGKLRRDSTGSG
jgi:hypothetical protein